MHIVYEFSHSSDNHFNQSIKNTTIETFISLIKKDRLMSRAASSAKVCAFFDFLLVVAMCEYYVYFISSE